MNNKEILQVLESCLLASDTSKEEVVSFGLEPRLVSKGFSLRKYLEGLQ